MYNIVVPKDLIEDTIETLERVGCQFIACEGPDKPFEFMRTCFVCSQIRGLREAIKDK